MQHRNMLSVISLPRIKVDAIVARYHESRNVTNTIKRYSFDYFSLSMHIRRRNILLSNILGLDSLSYNNARIITVYNIDHIICENFNEIYIWYLENGCYKT